MSTKFRTLAVLASAALSGCGGGPGGPPGFSVNVITAPVLVTDVVQSFQAGGSLAPDEAVDLVSESGGRVEAIRIQEGARVAKGDVLFEVDLQKAVANLATARARKNVAQSTANRAASLLKAGAVSQDDNDQAQAELENARANLIEAERRITNARIAAPFDGRVGARQVSPGQVVPPGAHLARLIDDDPVKIAVNLPERFAGRIDTGSRLDISITAAPDQTWTGSVYFVSPEVDARTRTFLIKGTIPNPDGRLKPGMFADATVEMGVDRDALLVPESAIVQGVGQATLFAVSPEGKAQARSVVLGQRLPGQVQVLSGVAAGDVVITEGVQKVRDGVPVNPTSATAEAP